jgi:hypothetical protein
VGAGVGWETRCGFYEGGIVVGGESRSLGSPGRTRSGGGGVGGKPGLGGWGSLHRRTKMHQVHFSVIVCIHRESARFSGAEVSSEQAEAEESCGGVGRARQTHGGASADKRGTPGAEDRRCPCRRGSGLPIPEVSLQHPQK